MKGSFRGRWWPALLALVVWMLVLPVLLRAEIKVLFIGNSFTLGLGDPADKASALGGVPGIFNRLAQAGGQTNTTTLLRAEAGQDYQFHALDATTQAAINSEPWTHVILQNYSTEPTHVGDAIHSLADHYTYGTSLYLRTLTNNPQTKVVLYETWSRAAAHVLITGASTPGSFASTAQFQTELRTNYHGLAEFLNTNYPAHPPVAVAPVGDAWENAGGLLAASEPAFVDLFASDNYHGNDNGYYLSAAVFYSSVYGLNPHGLSAHPLVSSLNLNFTVAPSFLEDVAWATVNGALGRAQPLLIDFGAAAMPTAHAASPDDPVNYWNNVTEVVGSSDTGQLSGLVTSGNVSTSIGFRMLSRFNGADTNGTQAFAKYAVNTARDSLFGNTEPFSGLSNVVPSFKFTGLNPAQYYQFSFYASRTAAGENLETGYTVTGNNAGYAALDAANNTDGTVAVTGIKPDAAGEVMISLSPTASNTSAIHFTSLGALGLRPLPLPEPVVFTREAASQTVFASQPASFSVAVLGTPPYFVHWLSNGVPIPEANQFTYTIPSSSLSMDGTSFSAIVSNLTYNAISTNAVLTVLTNPAAGSGVQSFLFDFGAVTTTTQFGPPPDDPSNFWNNVTADIASSPGGALINLVTAQNLPTSLGLVILSRFHSANENGTTSPTLFPADATRDSLFGNTEVFVGLSNIFPAFKLVGLDPSQVCDFVFYASRTGVGDNRETAYTVTGANAGFAALDVANNVTGIATVSNIAPSASGEITISLAPTANNNNANHFIYLGVLRLDARTRPLMLLQPVLRNGQVILNWAGTGQLEWAADIAGPWTVMTPAPASPYSESILPDQSRFFRLKP